MTRSTTTCDPAARVTRSLLGYGVLAGPVFVVTWLTEAFTRDGFDPTRHAASILANGDRGWIHSTMLIVTGVMTVVAAVGMRRALGSGRGRVWGPRLVGIYGVGVFIAGVFRADPSLGFPPGTPEGPGPVSWHGLVHFSSAGIGFLALIVGCLVFARRFAGLGDTGWAVYSAATGVIFFAAFAGVASGSAQPAINIAFSVAVVVAWAWLCVVSARFYREAGHQPA